VVDAALIASFGELPREIVARANERVTYLGHHEVVSCAAGSSWNTPGGVMAGTVAQFRKRFGSAARKWLLCASVVFALHDHGWLVASSADDGMARFLRIDLTLCPGRP